MDTFDALWDRTQDALAQRRTWQRGRNLALGALVGLTRRTVSGLITATGQPAGAGRLVGPVPAVCP